MNQKFSPRLIVFLTFCLMLTGFSVLSRAEDTSITVNDEAALTMALTDPTSPAKLILGSDLAVVADEDVWLTVVGQHSLDLNGFSLSIRGCRVGLCLSGEGTSLTVYDSSEHQDGVIHADSDLFDVTADTALTLNSGIFEAGYEERLYIADGIEIDGDTYHRFSGYVTDVTNGNTVSVKAGGTLTVNGGILQAHGPAANDHAASACIQANGESTLFIRDGIFRGLAGADVFSLSATASLSVIAGEFDTEPLTARRGTQDLGAYTAVVTAPLEGSVNLPVAAFSPVAGITVSANGETITPKETDVLGTAEDFPFYIRPTVGGTAKLSATGIRNNRYRPGATASLSVQYTPLFSAKDPSSLSYRWFVITADGQSVALPTTESQLTLETLSDALTWEAEQPYVFFCTVTERYNGTHAYTVTSTSNTFSITPYSLNSEIASVSLNPSSISSDNRLGAGQTRFSVSAKAAYTLTDTVWYPVGETTALGSSPTLLPNAFYTAVFTLRAKEGYRFTADTRVSAIAGGESALLSLSRDGITATITATLATGCSHTSVTYCEADMGHHRLCALCGYLLATEDHHFPSEATVDHIRTCTACGASDNGSYSDQADSVTVIRALTLSLGIPVENTAPQPVTLTDLTLKQAVVCISSLWCDADGNPVTVLRANSTYTVTVRLSVSDADAFRFAENSVLTVPYGTVTAIQPQEDGRSLNVTLSVTPLKNRTVSVTPPVVTSGNRIANTRPTVSGLTEMTVIWYQNGSPIGSLTVKGKTVSAITDLAPDDGIAFSTAKFSAGHTYLCLVTVPSDGSNYTNVIQFKSTSATATAPYPGACGGFGISYTLPVFETVIRHVDVRNVNPPKSGYAPDVTADLPSDATYTLKTLTWSLDSDRFYCGNTYSLTVTLAPIKGCRFAPAEDITASINGQTVTYSFDGSQLTVTMTFDPPPHIFANDEDRIFESASCQTPGAVIFPCRYCKEKATTVLPVCNQLLLYREAIPATCVTSGLSAHRFCPDCYTVFSDTEDATTSLSALWLAPNTTAHTDGSDRYQMNAVIHYHACPDCGDAQTDQEPHTFGAPIDGTLICSICQYSCPEGGLGDPPVSIKGETEPIETVPVETETSSREPLPLSGMLLNLAIVFALLILATVTVIVLIVLSFLRKKPQDNNDHENSLPPSV